MKCNTQRNVHSNFDQVADLYEEVRPQYPEDLVLAVVKHAQLNQASKVLELGSGTGQATQMFKRYGCFIDCIEPGRNLAEIARAKFASDENIHIYQSTFEDWQLEGRTYDLVMSATAFHWIPADVAYSKTAEALKPGGVVALF